MKTKILMMILAIGFWMGFNQVQAVPITIYIEGNVTSVAGTGRESVSDTIYAGVTFSGIYTYDSDALDSDPSDIYGVYQYDSPYGISIVIGGYEFKTTSNHIGKFEMQISNDDPLTGTGQPWDYYTVFSKTNISIPTDDLDVSYISWSLGDGTHTALSSDVLPIKVPVLEDWNYNSLGIVAYDSLDRSIVILGKVTQVSPEPLTGILMAMGVVFLRRKR
jgi:hypothetical protein